MNEQPAREIVACLNRTFESGLNPDGSTNIRTSLMRLIALRKGSWPKVKEVCDYLTQKGYVTILQDLEHTEAIDFGRIKSFIPER